MNEAANGGLFEVFKHPQCSTVFLVYIPFHHGAKVRINHMADFMGDTQIDISDCLVLSCLDLPSSAQTCLVLSTQTCLVLHYTASSPA